MSEDITEDKLLTQGLKKIFESTLASSMKEKYLFFFANFRPTDNQLNVFINLKNKEAITAYIFKHLIRTAIKYKVPKIFISEYYNIKDVLKSKYYSEEYKKKYKRSLYLLTDKLIIATYQMRDFLNSRKFKINNILNN